MIGSNVIAIFWALPAAAAIHVFEEFVYPGGFAQWYREYRPDRAGGMSKSFFFWINALLIGGSAWIAFSGPADNGVAWWLAVAGIMGANAVFHLHAVFKTGRYSPGAISSAVIYLPMVATGFSLFVFKELISLEKAVVMLAAGPAYHMFSAWNHARRTKLSRRG